jgi:hypothetical protein
VKKEIIKEGVVSELNGKYWGVEYQDGQSTSYSFGPIERAEISESEFCKKPTDITWTPENGRFNPDYDQLLKSKLVKVKITIIYEIEDA